MNYYKLLYIIITIYKLLYIYDIYIHIHNIYIYIVVIARCRVQYGKYFPSFSYFATYFTSV